MFKILLTSYSLVSWHVCYILLMMMMPNLSADICHSHLSKADLHQGYSWTIQTNHILSLDAGGTLADFQLTRCTDVQNMHMVGDSMQHVHQNCVAVWILAWWSQSDVWSCEQWHMNGNIEGFSRACS